jgi:ArsR family transcriptional regulator
MTGRTPRRNLDANTTGKCRVEDRATRTQPVGGPDSPVRIARVLSALADPTRLRILALLSAGERCVCEIHQSLRLPQPTVSRHLALLRRAGLVATRKDGLWVHDQMTGRGAGGLRPVVEAVEACLAASSEGRRDRARLHALPACCAGDREQDDRPSVPAPSSGRRRQIEAHGRPGGSRADRR